MVSSKVLDGFVGGTWKKVHSLFRKLT